jgi:hypothetical protein
MQPVNFNPSQMEFIEQVSNHPVISLSKTILLSACTRDEQVAPQPTYHAPVWVCMTFVLPKCKEIKINFKEVMQLTE